MRGKKMVKVKGKEMLAKEAKMPPVKEKKTGNNSEDGAGKFIAEADIL